MSLDSSPRPAAWSRNRSGVGERRECYFLKRAIGEGGGPLGLEKAGAVSALSLLQV